MSLSDDDLRAIWHHASTDVLSNRSSCLSDAEWARLLSNDADDAERARAAEHIGSCSQCADEYRLLQPLQSWAADVERVLSPGEAARANRRSAWLAWCLSPRFALAAVAATVVLVMPGVMWSRLVESRRTNALLETQLAEHESVLSATQTSLTALQEKLRSETAMHNELQQRLAQLSTPQLDFVIADLEPQFADVVRGSSDPQIVTTAANAPIVTLILNFPAVTSRSTLEVNVADESGQVRWVGRTQRDQGSATVTLALPDVGYPAGAYVIRLFDVTRGRTLLGKYPVVIRRSPESSR